MDTRQSASSTTRASGAVLGLLVVVAAALVAIGGVAYACTGRASLYDVTPSSGQSGDTVTVKGENYHDGEVEIRWDDAEGQLLGTAQGPSFTKQVTIPEADAGNYAMVGIAYDELTGEEEGRDAKPFRVLSADDPSDDSPEGADDSSDEPSSQSSTSGEPSRDSTDDNSSSQEPSSQDSSQEPTSQDSTSPEPTAHDATSQQPSSQDSTSQEPSAHDATSQEPSSQDSTSREPSSNDTPENADSGASERREQSQQAQPNQGEDPPSGPASSDQAAGTGPTVRDDDAVGDDDGPDTASEPEFESGERGGLATAPEARRPETRPSDSDDSSDETTNPSSRTGSQDLWGGLESGEGPGRAPSLDEPSAEGELAGAGQHLAVAAGLLGAGLVLLMGGVLVAAMRRRTLATAEREERPRR